MKKKVIGILLTAAMTLSTITGCGQSNKPEAPDATINLAMVRTDVTGKIVIYTSMYDDIIDDVRKEMKEVFPNLEVEFFQGGTGTIQSKIETEMDLGKLGCDILMVAEPSYSLELKEKGVLHPYKYSEADKLKFDYDKEGYWYPVRTLNMVLAYNPDIYDKSQVPHTMKGFAEDSSVKGEISMSNPLTSGTAYASIVALLDKYGEGYFKSLGLQNVAIESGSDALTRLESGECKEAMILEESVLKKRQEEGSSLEVIYPDDGCIPVPSTIMIVDDKYSANANTAAAEAVEDYFLSPAGQLQIVKGWMYSVRSDVNKYPYDGIPLTDLLKNTIPVDWNRCYKDREEIRTLFQEYVTVPETC